MLSVKKINVYYNGLQALTSVSLNLRAEEFVCILGPNGAGKSTLLQTIAGLLSPKDGEIDFEDQPIHRMAAHEVAGVGIALVPEEGLLYPQMNVQENLFMGAFPKEARKNLARQIQLVYGLFPILRDRRKQPAETLSGGERQMLAVGRGLMANPRLLMLDEPSLGLAPLVVKDILNNLGKINHEEKITILLTEQNIFHALKLSQRGYLLENSAIVMEASSKELLGNEHIKKNYLGL
jgi:branched-chain amino acid transport system ATP-binding protein